MGGQDVYEVQSMWASTYAVCLPANGLLSCVSRERSCLRHDLHVIIQHVGRTLRVTARQCWR